ncbi:MAG TPA: hypothetical protein VG452_09955 [Egibacteraceae bacterium]|nr:hypothetical protein [Actinomycetota bacterium]HWB72532.1 hypothetical protein [Egibacteraceae bacterium]
MATPQPLLVVTTRSRLRGAHLFPSMFLASSQIRRQLARTEGIVRWASIVAGPTEFWTITVWRSRHLMQEFMRSGEHGYIMWRISRWLDSFWLTRWRSGPHEVGDWAGLSLAMTTPRDERAEAPATAGVEPRLPDIVLQNIPSLRAAVGADGAITYQDAPFVRRRREQVRGTGGAIVRIRAPLPRMLGALREMRRLRRRLLSEPDLLRVVVGVGRPGEVYLLGVWRDAGAAARLLESDWVRSASARWPGLWAAEWLPENEFGHWDGMRLRRESRRRRPVDPAGRSEDKRHSPPRRTVP